MSRAAPQLVAGVDIKVDGQPLDPTISAAVLEARVQDNLMLPDAFTIRLRDTDFKLVDGTLLDIGSKVELQFAQPHERGAADGKFKGEITTIAPQFEHEGVVLVVRGYDVSHRLNRSRHSRTFQDMTASDIAKKVIGECGLKAKVESTSGPYPFEQQSNETDWAFLWRIAARVGFEVACIDETIHFRKPGADAGTPVKLEWGQGLLGFHPRATGIQQVEKVTVNGWDPKAKRPITADNQNPHMDSKIGLDRKKVAGDLGGGAIAVSREIVTSQGEATSLAQSTMDKLANAWLEAEGRCVGNPAIRAGCKVQLSGIGTRFGGEYLVTKSTHVVRDKGGYETHFEISGRSRRTLLDLLTPTTGDDHDMGLCIGIVTNNDDPEKMGRVRVKFPWLDAKNEGWWARVASPSASGKRGMMMMPLVDDEVVVGFEHGDLRRPFVLGSLFGGTSKPEALATGGKNASKPDGSFKMKSDKEIGIESKGDMDLKAGAKLALDVASDATMKIGGSLSIKADGSQIEIKGPSGSVTITSSSIEVKGPQITIDASASLTLKSSGIVKVSGSQVMLG